LLDHTQDMRRSYTKLFENAFAQNSGATTAFSFWKGRTALHALLKALGIGENDEVILPAYTCWSAVAPILWVGATPIFVEIDSSSLNIDANAMEKVLTPNTRAAITQHTFGRRDDTEKVLGMIRGRRVALIEDAAHCVGTAAKGQLVCSQEILATYWSFGWGKGIDLGCGGMITTNNSRLARKILRIQSSAVQPPLHEEFSIALYKKLLDIYIKPDIRPSIDKVFSAFAGFRSPRRDRVSARPVNDRESQIRRLGRLQAMSGLAISQAIEKNRAHRHQIVNLYNDLFDRRGWRVAPFNVTDDPLILYPVYIENRAELLEKARMKSINIGPWWTAAPSFQCGDASLDSCLATRFPMALEAYQKIIGLPTHLGVTEKEAQQLVNFVVENSVQVSR